MTIMTIFDLIKSCIHRILEILVLMSYIYLYLIFMFDLYISDYGVLPIYIRLWCLTFICRILVFDLYILDFGVFRLVPRTDVAY